MQNPAWLIHDHTFDLKSWVLEGKIKNQEFLPVYNESKYCIYHVSYWENVSVLERSDKTLNIRENSFSITHAGQSYEVESGVLHKSSALNDGLAVTVCETIERLNKKPIVVGDVKGKLKYAYKRLSVSKEEMLILLTAIFMFTSYS